MAFDWYTKAASAGDAGAQYTVASMYHTGLGTERDANKAVEWYKKAAEQKFEGAKAKLEEIYKTGVANKSL
jgi:TPR repeat protein